MTFEEIKAKIVNSRDSVSITDIKEIQYGKCIYSAMAERSTVITRENIMCRERHRIRLNPFWTVQLSRIIERFLLFMGMTKIAPYTVRGIVAPMGPGTYYS